jgi:hypothetical protein
MRKPLRAAVTAAMLNSAATPSTLIRIVALKSPRLSRYTVTRRYGAIGKPGVAVKGGKTFRETPWGVGARLFLAEPLVGMQRYEERFAELGLGDLLGPGRYERNAEAREPTEPTPSAAATDARSDSRLADDLSRICAALGTDCAAIRVFGKDDLRGEANFDPAASEAFFLANFAWFNSLATDPNTIEDERQPYWIALGRLVEWWRWRSSGLDGAAAARLASDVGLAKARQSKEPGWWPWAYARARLLAKELSGDSGRTNSIAGRKVAGIIREELVEILRQSNVEDRNLPGLESVRTAIKTMRTRRGAFDLAPPRLRWQGQPVSDTYVSSKRGASALRACLRRVMASA